MRLLRLLTLFGSFAGIGLAAESTVETYEAIRLEIAQKFHTAEKEGAHAVAGADGWFFLPSELRFLSMGKFWGEEAKKVSRASKADQADPLPAIIDFHDQLKQRGIELLLVPVPPKAAIYPEKLLPALGSGQVDAAAALHAFYAELQHNGIEAVDLSTLFMQKRQGEHGEIFCKTDTHWSGFGCVEAAEAIAGKVRARLGLVESKHEYATEWKQIEIEGDLGSLLPAGTHKPGPERLDVRQVTDKKTGKPVQSDPNSPLLLLGDSHTLVYHEFYSDRSGLADQLSANLGFAPEWIGTRGSGSTTVRSDLYRRSKHDPSYLSRKKMIIWCFAAREFTEADGWARLPVAP